MKKIVSLLFVAFSTSLMGMDEIEQREYAHIDSNAQAQLSLVYRYNHKGDQGPVKTYYLFNDAELLQKNLEQHRDNLNNLITQAPAILNQKATQRFTHGAASMIASLGLFINEALFPTQHGTYVLTASALLLLHSYRTIKQGSLLQNYARALPFDLKNRRDVTNQLLHSLKENGTTPFTDQQLHDGTI